MRKKEFPPHYIIFPAPTADEIISKLPHDWYGVDEASFAENNWLKPGIVTSETRFELQIEKNSFNEISCMYAMDNGHGISAFSDIGIQRDGSRHTKTFDRTPRCMVFHDAKPENFLTVFLTFWNSWYQSSVFPGIFFHFFFQNPRQFSFFLQIYPM